MPRRPYLLTAIAGAVLALSSALACGASPRAAADPVTAALAALRSLQYEQALSLLERAASAGQAQAQYLLGSIYLNGVGVVPDRARARSLLEAAAEHGDGAAAYVLSAELAHAEPPDELDARRWLERSAALGYARASELLTSGGLPLQRQTPAATDGALLDAWIFNRVTRNDAAELHRLGRRVALVRDEFARPALARAAECGALSAATALLELGADPRSADQFGTTALMLASELPDTAMLELLLLHGADPNAADHEQRTALFYAARTNRAAAIERLLRAGARLDALDSHDDGALDVALALGAADSARTLRALGAQPHVAQAVLVQQGSRFDAGHPGQIYRGWQAIGLAIARNDAAATQQLLGDGDGSQRLPGGDTLLQAALDARATEVVPVLLSRGADAAAPDHAGHCVLWQVIERHDRTMLAALLTHGVHPDSHCAGEDPPLVAAVRAKDSESVRALLAAGVDPDAADSRGYTALMVAAGGDDVGLLQTLLARHAQVTVADRTGRSALWHAAWSGRLTMVDALLGAGADLNAADAYGMTPLHAAAAHGQPDVMARLLEGEANINAVTAGGDTPLLLAAAGGQAPAVDLLLGQGAGLDRQDRAGDTALIAASRAGHGDICRALLRAGANRALRNAAHATAADVAGGRGFTALALELAGKAEAGNQ